MNDNSTFSSRNKIKFKRPYANKHRHTELCIIYDKFIILIINISGQTSLSYFEIFPCFAVYVAKSSTLRVTLSARDIATCNYP